MTVAVYVSCCIALRSLDNVDGDTKKKKNRWENDDESVRKIKKSQTRDHRKIAFSLFLVFEPVSISIKNQGDA